MSHVRMHMYHLFFQIDAASFLSSKAAIRNLFPEDTTMLVTRTSSSASPSDSPEEGASSTADEGGSAAAASRTGGGGEEGAGGVGGGEGVLLVELKSFTTQAFFTCWRALHLGLLQVIPVCWVGFLDVNKARERV